MVERNITLFDLYLGAMEDLSYAEENDYPDEIVDGYDQLTHHYYEKIKEANLIDELELYEYKRELELINNQNKDETESDYYIV